MSQNEAPEQKDNNLEDQPAPFINPISEDDVAENPHLLTYAHTRGGAVIKPVDRGRVKGLALNAMYEQTDMHLDQIREQIEVLARQAKAIQDRVGVSEKIYQAKINFQPRIGHTYHLYERENGESVLSLVGPKEWGPNPPYNFIATVKMLADHTWDIL